MDLSGKGVFLTGGARGLGRGMTEALLSKGAKVLFSDILTEAGRATEAEFQTKYGAENVCFRRTDVTDAEELKAAFDAAVSKFGAVDICINNAGIIDERVWEKMFAVNTVAQIRGSQLALDHMRRDRGGRGGLIINTVSVSGVYPSHYFPVYCATKHAMIGFIASWAKNPKMADMGITWRALCPDAVYTDLLPVVDGQVHDAADFRHSLLSRKVLQVSDLIEGFMKMILDQDSTDVIFEVKKPAKGVFRKRQVVDSDGVSNPVTVD